MSTDFKVRHWQGECREGKHSKFYHLIAISGKSGEWSVQSISGRIGMSGLLQPMKTHQSFNEIERFVQSKIKRGYKTKKDDSANGMEEPEIRAVLDSFVSPLTQKEKDKLPPGWVLKMMGVTASDITGAKPVKRTEVREEVVIKHTEPENSYGEQWGAWA